MICMAAAETTIGSNSCIALFSSCSEALTAMQKLATAGFTGETISAVGKLFSVPQDILSTLPFVSQPQPPVKIIQFPGNEAMLVSGFLLPVFSREAQKEPGIECRKIIPFILSDIGIPAVNQPNYSSAIEHGQAVVIVRGSGEQVETAADLLATGKEVEVAVYQENYLCRSRPRIAYQRKNSKEQMMNTHDELTATIADLVQPGRGILAADESLPTITKRFQEICLPPTEKNRRDYRIMLFGTSGLGSFISGTILFEETLGQQTDDGIPLPELLQKQGIVVGVKADTGNGPLTGALGDRVTRGLDDLEKRLKKYKKQGARFAKWREVYPITPHNPTKLGRRVNAQILARYAAVCQEQGIVPIVEPEVLMDGNHDINRCAAVTEYVLHSVFHALHQHGVFLEGMILKPNMVLPGKASDPAEPDEIAEATLRTFKRTVPAAVPSINFLSGGQSPEEATNNFNAINVLSGKAPWSLGISFGRALQKPALHIWNGKPENRDAARAALLKRAQLNSLAQQGQYSPDME